VSEQPTRSERQTLLSDGRNSMWVFVCEWCECVIVNPQPHARVCPNNPGVTP
jgi:hypothetical protein